MKKTYYAYIMAGDSRVIYTGVTSDLARRVLEHRHKLKPGFSSRYGVRQLVYFEVFGEIRVAIAREKQIKGWSRAKKILPIESFNPRWRDLSCEL